MIKILFIMTRMLRDRTNLTIAVSLLFMISSCDEEKPANTSIKTSTTPDSISCFVVRTDSVQKSILLPGELIPFENIQIRAKVPGYIRKMNVDIGSKVTKGQVLALIDAPEINTQLQESGAKVNAAKSRYLSSKDIYERLQLASKTDGVIAGRELQQSLNQMMADSAEYSGTSFAASSSKHIGSYLAILAPYSGIITKRNIDAGSFVGNTNDAPLFELQDNKKLRLRVAVPEIYTGALLVGNEGDLTTRSAPDKKFKAKLVRRSGAIDKDSRSETWEFEVPNETNEIKSGSYADVKLHFLRSKNNLVVPVSSVVTTLERKFVIKVSDHTTIWMDVRSGFNMGDKQEIFGQLAAGDTIVLKANEEIKPGTKINTQLNKY